MTQETELKIQSLLDGELAEAEKRQVEALVRLDAQAATLFRELTATRKTLVGNELARPLPESGDFHWSQIRRQIAAQAGARPRPAGQLDPWFRSWPRFVIPAAGAAVVAILLAVTQYHPPVEVTYQPHDVELPLREMSAITFHSQSANMTVVWVQNEWD